MAQLQRYPDRKKKPSYFWEMVKHRYSLYGFLGAVASGAALSVVSGGLAAIPFVGYLAAEGIASLFIPSSSWWRDKVDTRYRKEHREKLRGYLTQEIERRVGLEHSRAWNTYRQMRDRIHALETTAREKMTTIQTTDVERLDDATVNYLSLWLLTIVMRERQASFRAENVPKKLADVERALDDKKLQGTDRARLEKAKSDLEKVIERSKSVDTQVAAAESGMLTLADALEEFHQNVMRNPQSEDVRSYLKTAVDHMRIEEGLEVEMDRDLHEAFEELERNEASAKSGA